MVRTSVATVAAGALLALAACGNSHSAETPGEEVSTRTVAALLSDADELSRAGEAFVDAGLAAALDSNPSYTVFAPTDEAFASLGETSAQMEGEGAQAAMAAILRDHVVPGFVTRADIEQAIAGSDNQSASLQTMGNHPLTFRSDEDGAITVSTPDGSEARVVGTILRGSNGVVMPIDAVLKSFPESG